MTSVATVEISSELTGERERERGVFFSFSKNKNKICQIFLISPKRTPLHLIAKLRLSISIARNS